VIRRGLDAKPTRWRFLNWERQFIDRDTVWRKLMYAGQIVVPRVVPHLATSWVCAATPVATA
jgi:hypothetical protein